MCCRQLKGFNGYYAAVFDGNSGWQVADFCSKKLHLVLEKYLKDAKNEEDITVALNKAFAEIEKEWGDFVNMAFHVGYP